MNLQPFFTYFGGKWRSAVGYDLPRLKRVVEPFAGSAGYSVRNYQADVVLYDLDPIIVGVWDYLIKAPAIEIRNLPLVVEDSRTLPCCQEARWLIGSWLNKGTTSPCNIPGKWMRDYAGPATGQINTYWGEGIRDRIASQVDHIRHWRVYERSFEGVPNWNASWFIDPPYQVSGKRYRFGSRGIDFTELGKWCRSRRGQVQVCEQLGVDWLDFQPHAKIKALEGKNGSKVSMEVIWKK